MSDGSSKLLFTFQEFIIEIVKCWIPFEHCHELFVRAILLYLMAMREVKLAPSPDNTA